MPTDIRTVLKATSREILLQDERGRTMSFPGRRDYVWQLQKHGLVMDEAALHRKRLPNRGSLP